ncbi:hypothetical protein [Micromonospora carbonacea]
MLVDELPGGLVEHGGEHSQGECCAPGGQFDWAAVVFDERDGIEQER